MNERIRLLDRAILFVLSVFWMGLCAWQRFNIERNGGVTDSDGGCEFGSDAANTEVIEAGEAEDARFKEIERHIETV